jgi:hypothetical protein
LKDYKNDFNYHLPTFWASQSFLISLAHNGFASAAGSNCAFVQPAWNIPKGQHVIVVIRQL